MAEGVNVANAFVSVMPSMEGVEANLASVLSGAMEGAGDAAGRSGGESIGSAILGQLQGLGSSFLGMGGEAGTALAGGIESVLSGAGGAAIVAAAGALALAIGGELMEIGGTFDEMTDEIVVGTGASGDALRGLADVATNIGTSVPTSFATAGDIVQEFNTRMGLTGPTLEDVGSKAAALQSIVGDVNLGALTGALNEFGISGEQASQEMDYLFGVSQSTGIGFNDLVSVVQSSGPALQQLGFSFNDVADMAGQLDKAGLSSSQVMGSMKRALSSVAEQGGDVRQAFADSVGAIRGYIAAGDDASAINAAKDIFGTRNAPQFVAALKSGAVSLDELGQSALGAQGDIMGTMEATADWPETWQLIQNRVAAALEPLGSAVWGMAASAMEGAGSAMDALWQASEPLRTTMADLASGAFAALQPVLQPLADALGNMASATLPLLSGAFTALSGALQVVGAAVSALWGLVSPLVAILADGLAAAANTVAAAMQVAGAVLSAAGSTFSSVASAIQGAWAPVGGFFASVVSSIQSSFDGAVGAASGMVSSIVSTISDLPGQIWSWISQIPGKFSAMWSSIHIPTFHIEGGFNLDPANFSVPHLSFYAAGGYIDRPTAIVGEAGGEFVWPSRTGYIERYAEALVDAMGAGAGGTTTVNQYVNATVNRREDPFSTVDMITRSLALSASEVM